MATAMTATRSPLLWTVSRSPFAVSPASNSRTEHRGLSHWMNRVLEELGSLQTSPEADTVHDLRVAIRRCRSLAAAMEEIDPDLAWPQMRKTARRLFRTLGALRDVQVMKDWVKKFAAESDPLRGEMLPSLEAEEKRHTESAMRVAAKFDEKEWTRLERRLRVRARIVPVGGLAAECLALERFEEAKELHNHALRTEKHKPWHALRIGLKRFRYTVEGLLPEHYAAWSENLKRLQDLLGDVHDLDVLAAVLKDGKTYGALSAAEAGRTWQERISRERRERIETYRQLTLGNTSLWHEWRLNLPHAGRLDSAASARIAATARAAGAYSRRTAQVSRLAMRLFDLLRRAHAAPVFREANIRRMMQAAAKLHGITTIGERRLSQKEVRKYLQSLAVPPNWTREEWKLMAWAVRFHRGTEPKQKNGYAKLTPEEQTCVRALAGILRLARGLRKCGVERAVGFRPERSSDAIVLRIPDLADTEEAAGRIATAKHLLESVLSKPLILKAVASEKKAAEPAEPPPDPPLLSLAASA